MTIDPIHLGSAPNDGSGQNLRSGGQTINDNFAELDTRTATAQATAEQGVAQAVAAKAKADAAIPASALGATVAQLVNGTVPVSQLPSFVDDVLEFATLSVFPVVGEAGKIYIATDTNSLYRWTDGGRQYLLLSAAKGINSDITELAGLTTALSVSQGGTGGKDQAGAMAGLGLGTAATANITTSVTDSTVGRVLKVGDFGVGAPLLKNTGTPDAKIAQDAGAQFSYLSASDKAPGMVADGALATFGANTDYAFQLAMDWRNGAIYSRYKAAAAPTLWRKLVTENSYMPRLANGDLNNYTANIQLWADHTCINVPFTSNWYVEVIGVREQGPAYSVQRATNMGTDMVYVRQCIANTWGAWEKTSVETITNANGTATKFPDGTMICRTVRKEAGPTNIAVNAGLFINSGIPFQWPVAFVGDLPMVNASSESYSVSFSWAALNIAPSLTGIQDVRTVSTANGALAKLCVSAVGRWK
ncbi:hypothetical protein P7C00_06685 [Pseudomonas sp. JDS08PS003]|uniref:pyocin knob domain-containing protein n=1 Tax=Pseudomonas sp. JDS08PS003 TaxID=2497162 RepID=UPI003857BA9D